MFSHAKIKAEFRLDDLDCQLIETADGSWSLRLGTSCGEMTEPMHSSKGAWSETLEIYEPALKDSLQFIRPGKNWRVASVGLGLGYNEILAAGMSLRHGYEPSQVSIVSFESRQELTEAFKSYFQNSTPASSPNQIAPVYDDILIRTARFFNLDQRHLQDFICKLVHEQRLDFRQEITIDLLRTAVPDLKVCDCLLFDAFSPSSSPDLWNPELLQLMVETLAGPECIFVSYASRTVLKKVLKENGFRLQKKAGFAGKREATFAVRLKTEN